jgi:outer membrane protein assembly factor BamE (lipoprotein component of BamABCDE complex)
MRISVRKLLFILSLLVLTSCVNNYKYIGLKVSKEDIEHIKSKKLSDEQVADLIGSPTISSDVGGRVWYYVYNVTDKVAFFRPKLVDEEIIEIKFDQGGHFLSLKVYDSSAIKAIGEIEETTPTHGTKSNPVQQIIRNIQKYSVPNFGRKKPGGI